jgi:NAD(P)-dependent dehydrogenase (short-subunit alcohol dehydrogenase family)
VNPQGKVALITGGAHRVGKAITLVLAQAGAHVVINYNDSKKAAEQTLAEARAFGVDALALQCDVSDWSAVQEMAAMIERHFEGVDIIVNSASYFGRTPFPSTDPAVMDAYHKVTRILLDGAYFVCNRLAPGMLGRGAGAIINIVDLSAWNPWPNFLAHSVGKAGLLAMTRQMALELAPTVRANAIAPGPVLPPSGYSEERNAASARRTLLERWGNPEDVALAVKFLVEADYITGEVITVDGGERFGHNKRKGEIERLGDWEPKSPPISQKEPCAC